MTRLAAPLAALTLVVSAADGTASDRAPDLTGRWQLNRDRSDDARKKMQDAREAGQKGRGGIGGLGPIGPGPRGGGPLGGGPVGGRPMGGQPAGGRTRPPDDGTRATGPISELMDPPKILVITQTEGEVTFDKGDDSLLRLRPGGRKVKREGGAAELRARWKDDELVVEAERDEGPRTVTTYRVTSDRQELHVTTRVEGALDEVVVRHVYDAAPSP